MAKPAKKIWCPKCHKRHRLPANAGGMTLRCRGCKFAFRVQDGLTQDPTVGPVDAIVIEEVQEPAIAVGTQALTPVQAPPPPAVMEPDPEPVTLDHDYEHILDVLDTPSAGTIAPQRAHAPATMVLPAPQRTVAVAPVEPEPVREPVSRKQLRAHRNARQFWMLISLLFACLLGAVSWFGVNLFMNPTLSQWERKMLYAIGIPARWLPPQAEGELEMLPPNHVRLRGEHVKLADRNDFFRDEFPAPVRIADNEEVNVRDELKNKIVNRGGPRNGDQGANNRDEPPKAAEPMANAAPPRKFSKREEPRLMRPPPKNEVARNQPARKQPARKQPVRKRDVNARPNKRPQAANAARRGPNKLMQPGAQVTVPLDIDNPNNPLNGDGPPPPAKRKRQPRKASNAPLKVPRNAWQPPELSTNDVVRVASSGLDPKLIQTMSVESGPGRMLALEDQTVFSIAAGNRLVATEIGTGTNRASQKLDKAVAAICTAVEDGISNRPAVWLLYKTGLLEKFDFDGDELNRKVSVSLRPVFKEKFYCLAASKRSIAYSLKKQVIIADILEAAGKADQAREVQVDGQVFAMRFSDDGTRVLALVESEMVLINAILGEVISRRPLTSVVNTVDLKPANVTISSDLSTLFVCRGTSIDAIKISDGTTSGRYRSGIPFPLQFVVSHKDRMLGFSDLSPSPAALFRMMEMEFDGARRDDSRESKSQPEKNDDVKLLGGKAPAQARPPYELDRSPRIGASIRQIMMLPGQKIAFLTQGEKTNRICIATWGQDWSIRSLRLDPGMNIRGFDISDDLSRIAVFSDDIVQAWKLVNPDTGETRFVSESVAHTGKVTKIMLTNDGERIVSGDWSGKVHVSSFESGKRTGGINGFVTAIKDIAPKGGEGYVVMSEEGITRGSGNATRDKITKFGTFVRGATALSKNGNRIAYYHGLAVKIADVSSQKILAELTTQSRPDFIAFSGNSKYVLLQTGKQISVWEWRKRSPERVRVFRYSSNSAPATAQLDMSPDGSLVGVITGEDANQISIFEMPEDEK